MKKFFFITIIILIVSSFFGAFFFNLKGTDYGLFYVAIADVIAIIVGVLIYLKHNKTSNS